MSFFREGDILGMLSDFGEAVTVGGEKTQGVVNTVDRESVSEDMAHFSGKVVTVQVKTGALAALKEGATLSLDAGDYRVLATQQLGDGAITLAYCTPK